VVVVPGAIKSPVPPTFGIMLSGFVDDNTTSTKTNNTTEVIDNTAEERPYNNTTRSLLVLNHEKKRCVSVTNIQQPNIQLIVVAIDINTVLYCKVITICNIK
jgi:hypothetical protein